MAQHQPTAQYQPNQFPVQRQKPTGRNTAEPSKPPVLPKNLVFDGKTNWTLFKQKFESYATAAGWTDEKKTDMLIWGLKGKAADFNVLLCNMNGDLSYKHLMSEFGKRFKREELPETLQARFQNECQDEGETLRDWADRILTLAAKAYKDLPEAWIRRHAIIRICMGCLDLEAGQHACTQQPKSFVEAMDKMERFQCINKTSKSRRPSSKTTKSDPPVNAYTCKSYEDYDTDSCSDEEEDESEGYLQSTIKTKHNISPYSSIYRTDSGLIPSNEFPQSGTSTPGLTEVARQMSKVSDEMSTLAVMSLILHQGSRICCVKLKMVHYKDLVVLLVVAHNIWLKNVCPDYQEVQGRGLFNSKTVSQKPTGRRSRSDPRPSKARPKD